MTALVSGEMLKLRTLRVTWVIVAVALALSAVIGVAQVRIAVTDSTVDPVDLLSAARAPAQALWFLATVLALLVAAGEFHHRTIRTTLLAAPHRGRVLVAKCAASLITGVALLAAGTLVAGVAGAVTAAASGYHLAASSGSDAGHLAAAILLGGVWGVAAAALGVLTRSPAVAIAALLLWRFVGEAIVPVVTRHDGLRHWLPTGLADALTGAGGPGPLPLGGAAALLTAYVAALVAAATIGFLRTERL